jgi:hypothetical protein
MFRRQRKDSHHTLTNLYLFHDLKIYVLLIIS